MMRRRRGGVYSVEHTGQAANGETRTLTAAVQVISGRIQRGRGGAGKTSVQSGWQVEAWEHYDQIGELRFSTNLLASAVSRCNLVAARIVPGMSEPETVTSGLPADLVASWAGGPDGQAQFLKRGAQHLTVPGDSYFVGRQLTNDEQWEGGPTEEWRPYSTEETTHSANGWAVNPGDGAIPLGDDDVIVRCWLPHPRRFVEADSPIRASLPALRELHGLTQRIMAEIDSRLAGNGLLILPQEFEFPSGQGLASESTGEASFVETLLDYMITPIKDRGSAAAVVPLIITAPGEHIGQAQHIKFFDELDGRSRELREAALERFARSADMPKELVMGLSDSNHWSAWAIDRDAVQLHIAPMAAVECYALTVGWYRPALEAAGVPNAHEYVVWFDPSPLEIPPDRSTSAKELYDRYAIGPATLRRENGFGDSDAPSPDELKEMILLKLVDRINDPRALFEALGVDLTGLPAADEPARAALPTGDDVDQVGPPNDGDPPADEDAAPVPVQASAAPLSSVELGYVAELAIQRALELAGKRLLTRHYRATRPDLNHVPKHTLHCHIPASEPDLDRLLEGVWDPVLSVVPKARELVDRLDEYVRDLLITGTAHEAQYLARVLSTGE